MATFSIQPAAMYVSNAFLSVPIAPMNDSLLSLSLAMLGLAWAVGPRIDEAWA